MFCFKIFRFFSALVVAITATAATFAQDNTLTIYNWSNYIGKTTLDDFTKETGIKVRMDLFDANETLHTKLMSGKSGYDLVMPSSQWAKTQQSAGVFRRLNKDLLPNLVNIDPSMRQIFSSIDPGNYHFVNWLWGFTTLGINVDRVKQALGGQPLPANIWELLFNKQYTEKLKHCGISLLDSPSEVIPAALLMLGKDPFSRRATDYTEVEALFKGLRSHITMFSSRDYIEELAKGDLCVALGWSGDLNVAKQQAIANNARFKIEVIIPQTGAPLFFDMMAIPVDAPNPENAHRFINYILRPEVHASLTNQLYYANANLSAKKFVLPVVAKEPTVYLPSHELIKMHIPRAINNDLRRKSTLIFNNFKNGL